MDNLPGGAFKALSNVRANGLEQAARRMAPRRGSQRVGLLKCLERAMTRDLMIAGTLVSLVALALYGVLGWRHRPADDHFAFHTTCTERTTFSTPSSSPSNDSIGLVGTSTMDIRSFVLERAAARPHIRGFAAQCNHVRAAKDAAMPSQRVYEHVRVSLRTDGQVAFMERHRDPWRSASDPRS